MAIFLKLKSLILLCFSLLMFCTGGLFASQLVLTAGSYGVNTTMQYEDNAADAGIKASGVTSDLYFVSNDAVLISSNNATGILISDSDVSFSRHSTSGNGLNLINNTNGISVETSIPVSSNINITDIGYINIIKEDARGASAVSLADSTGNFTDYSANNFTISNYTYGFNAVSSTLTVNGYSNLFINDTTNAISAAMSNVDISNTNIAISTVTGGMAVSAVGGSIINITGDSSSKNNLTFFNSPLDFNAENASQINISNMNINSDSADFAAANYGAQFSFNNSAVTLTGTDNVAFSASGTGISTFTFTGTTVVSDTLFFSDNTEINLFKATDSNLTGKIDSGDSKVSFTNTTWNMLNHSFISDLTLNGGRINMGSPEAGVFNQLMLGEYKASNNPTIAMNIVLDDGTSGMGDRIVLGSNASGNTRLLINNAGGAGGQTTGNGIEIIAAEMPNSATFSLVGGKVDTGGYNYHLFKGGVDDSMGYFENNFYLRSGDFSDLYKTMANMVEMTGILAKKGTNSLMRRLGDLRTFNNNENPHGIWARGYIYDLTVSGLIDTDLTMLAAEAGYDFLISGDKPDKFYVGVMGGYMQNTNLKTKQENGRYAEGDGSIPSLGLYGTWINDKGWFADITLRNFWITLDLTNYAANNAELTFKPKRSMLMGSVEFGRSLIYETDNANAYWRLEPKAELLIGRGGSKTVGVSTGQNLEYDSSTYINGRAAVLLGYVKARNNGLLIEPSLELAYSHEFDGKGDVRYAGATYETDLSGGGFDMALGLNMQFTQNLYAYAQLGYEIGKVVDGFSGNIGVRWGFGGGKKAAKQEPAPEPVQEPVKEEPAEVTPVVEEPIQTSATPSGPLAVYKNAAQFPFNDTKVSAQWTRNINKIAAEIKALKYSRVIVTGHTDNVGTYAANEKVSNKRAIAAGEVLEQAGVEYIETEGRAYNEPIASNDTQEGRDKNRRADIEVW